MQTVINNSGITRLMEASTTLNSKQRVGFILPALVVRELDKITKTHKQVKSQFVARAIAKAIDEEKRKTLQKELAKKYSTFSKEAAKLAEEWHTFELKDWDKL